VERRCGTDGVFLDNRDGRLWALRQNSDFPSGVVSITRVRSSTVRVYVKKSEETLKSTADL
jgi:hypothetical protein